MMQNEDDTHWRIPQAPSPLKQTDLDLLVQGIENSVYQIQMMVQNNSVAPELLMEVKKDLKFQTSNMSQTQISKLFHTQNSMKSSTKATVHSYSKTQCKNVLMTVRTPIADYFNRPSHKKMSKKKVLTKFVTKPVSLDIYYQLFKNKQVKNVLSEMFLCKYLKRAYQQSRTKQINKITHLHRIRELQRMFIEAHR